MQSFLTHNRFKRQVRTQYEHEKERTEAIGRGVSSRDSNTGETGQDGAPGHHRPSSIDSTSSNTEAGGPESRDAVGNRDLDLEKGDPEKGVEGSEGSGSQDTSNDIGDDTNEEDRNTLEQNPTVSRSNTTQSLRTRIGHAMAGIEVRTLSKELTKRRSRASRTQSNTNTRSQRNAEQDEKQGLHDCNTVLVVSFSSSDDPMNPHNWPLTTRTFTTILVAAIGFIVGFASSVDSAASEQAAAEFGVSAVAESLATGLFLIGFGVGALFAGPISETVGRNPVYIVTMVLYMIWIMASALAPNIGAQLVFRFLAGFFGSTPLTCAGGSISDLWNPLERVYAFPVFANAAFMGPIFGPVVGGFIGQSNLVSWRWTEWITLILSGLVLVLIVLFQPETYAPVLLKWKAAALREVTGDDRYVAEVEIRADPFGKRLLHALYRPFVLFFREPIVILFSLYLTVVYIILFTFLDGYTYIFGDTYGFSEGITGLSFLGIGIGLCFASLWIPLIHSWAKRDLKIAQEERGPDAFLPPEKRLWFAMFGAPAIPISLFWMGWTNYPSISYWSGLVASVVFGYGILCIFISTYQYIIDSYESYAASALASLTLIRYVAAGGMTVVGIPFYANLGVHWTLTILGAISALMVPVPYVFYIYGPKIRSYSKFAANSEQ